MKARLGRLIAVVGVGAVALSAAAQGSAELAVGPDAGGYLCPDGRQIYVKSCYDNAPDANCGVVLMHLPPQNGFQRESTQTRSMITPSVAACRVYPLEFRNDGTVGLVVPKSAAPQPAAKAPPAAVAPETPSTTIARDGGPPITVIDGMAIGREGLRSSLVRFSAPGSAPPIIYLDEASRRSTGRKDVVAIWMLQVWPDGAPSGDARVSAVWTDLNVNCNEHSSELTLMILLDRQANVLSATPLNERGTTTKDATKETPSNIACKRTAPSTGPRLASAASAIADAVASAAPKTAAKPATPPAQPDAAAQARQALLEGQKQLAADDYDKALAAFEQATTLDPTLRIAWVHLGDIYFGGYVGETDDAVRPYERALALQPVDIKIANKLCMIHWLAYNTDAAVRACEHHLSLKPMAHELPFAYGRLGQVYAKKGDLQKALAVRLEASRLDPASALGWRDLAETYVALNRNSDAWVAMQKAVSLEPKDAAAQAQLGDVLRRLSRRDEAVNAYREALRLEPGWPEYHAGLATVLHEAGRRPEADAEQHLAIEAALSKGRNALKNPPDGPVAVGSILSPGTYLTMLEKWDKAAAAMLAAEIKAAER